MKVSAFNFDLPEEAIALTPARPRDSARLLQVSSKGTLSDHHVYDLPALLRAGDVLVVNETRVLRAALKATRKARPHGGGGDVKIEINLHKRNSPHQWQAFVRPAKRVRQGDRLYFEDGLEATVAKKNEGGDVALDFNMAAEALDRAIDRCGAPPLPPYIGRKRALTSTDNEDYQTVYAQEKGSVAAPTAGLHFTPALLQSLTERGIAIEKLVLHVGAGTFLPMTSDDTQDHHMHSEFFAIDEGLAARVNDAKREGRRIIAVGTTSLRALESAAQDGQVIASSGETDIFITPGYQFQVIDGLMTNFHLPKSTLFMLVCALCGLKKMQEAYAYAITKGYRFYSYGDSSLLWGKDGTP